MARWMAEQAREEWGHGMKIHDFILERGGRVRLQAVEAPPAEFDSPLAIFQAALKHEQKVTGLIGGLVDQAKAENDHATGIFLQGFVSEQVEEEATAGQIVAKLDQIKDSPQGLFMMDALLGKRGAD
jgi:ferritin